MTVIAIGLDSAEPSAIEKWMQQGFLPNLKKLKSEGAYGRLDNYDVFTAELPWTTFATGAMPEDTGYWTPLKYDGEYGISTRAAYEYKDYKAFYALGDDYRVCAFDIPQVRLQESLNGYQINAWGAHSPQVKQESKPAHVIDELNTAIGKHPGLHQDYAHALNMKATRDVYNMLMKGVARRGEACLNLLKREPWDLFLTVFGEPHGAGHNFWQFQPDHPLYGQQIENRELLPEDPLRDVYQAIDHEIGRIVDNAAPDDDIIIFSAHGMGPNTMDLPSCLFLPELMYRYSFNRPALCDVPLTSEQMVSQQWNNWERHVWSTLKAGSPMAQWIRKNLPTKLYNKLAPIVGDDVDGYPMSPSTAAKVHAKKPWYQPNFWYSKLWPSMKAFSLPSFSEGYIRLNVEGREAEGIIKPEDYLAEVDNICRMLEELTCTRTGEKMVRKVVKTRDDPLDKNSKHSDADIVIAWQEVYASDSVTHPKYGQIGPAPHFRAGSHRHEGFILAKGQNIPANMHVSGHALDIGPTILNRLKAGIPEHMRGEPITQLMTQNST